VGGQGRQRRLHPGQFMPLTDGFGLGEHHPCLVGKHGDQMHAGNLLAVDAA